MNVFKTNNLIFKNHYPHPYSLLTLQMQSIIIICLMITSKLSKLFILTFSMCFICTGAPHVYAASLQIPPSYQLEGLEISSTPKFVSNRTEYVIPNTAFSFEEPVFIDLQKAKDPMIQDIIVTIPSKKILPLTSNVEKETATPSPSPTVKPTVTPSPKPSTTPNPTPSSSNLPTPKPTVVPVTTPPIQSTSGLNADLLFSMIQSHRATKGLPPFEKDQQSCSLAASRAPEVDAEVAQGRMHSGLKARNIPYWNTENIISIATEQQALRWWLNDYIHRIAIEGNYKYSCLACSGNACAQEFTNFEPK
jgi:uncharacterized protein YkwD